MEACAVIKCAATGVYIGGPGSRAELDQSDVVLNGLGSRLRGGIARGHSGIYLEQGEVKIVDSCISNNTLTGISAVSSQHAFLNMSESELLNNGSFQLELPPSGTPAHRRSQVVNNRMALQGPVKLRSGMLDAKVNRRLGCGRMTWLHRGVINDNGNDLVRRNLPAAEVEHQVLF
jgi:hypothetical protein